MDFSAKRPPPKSRSAQNLNVHWQCVFCRSNFPSEREKDLHTSACSHKEYFATDKFKPYRPTKPLPPPLHATGQGKVVKVSGQSCFRSLSLDASLQEQPVNLIWKKQCQTIDTEITYFDNQNGVIQLKWDKLNKYYKNSAYLTPGNHSGCLTLTDSDSNGDTKPFYVLEKSDLIQEFTLSLVQVDETKNSLSISSKEDTMKSLKKRLKDQEARIKELEQKCEKLVKENEKLKKEKDKSKSGDGKGKSSELESLKTAVQTLEIEKQEAEAALRAIAGQKNETGIANSRLQKELDTLKQQLAPSHKEKEDLRNLDFDNLTESDQNMFWKHHDKPKVEKEKNANYFNMDDLTRVYELQNEVSELKKRHEEREREAAEAKSKSDEIIDYLHGEKVRLESELESAKELNLLNRERYSPAPNIPPTPPKPRSNPIPSNTSTGDQFSKCEPHYKQPFIITCEGREYSVLPLSYFNPSDYLNSIVFCKPTPDAPHHISCVLSCTFLDPDLNRPVSGVSFFREVGTCDGEYKGVRYFNTEPKKATFLASDIVLVKVPGLPQINHPLL